MSALSTRESACLCAIAAFMALEGRAPSYLEIARALGLGQKSQAAKIVNRLRARKLLDRGGDRAKGARVGELRFVGHLDQFPQTLASL